jgi:uncharacterized DUF497 family protein
MSIEWDSRKAAANLQKLGVDFADAATALEDDRAVTVRDIPSGDEARYLTPGMDALGRVLVVVISARPATTRERRQYGDNT